MTEINVNLRFSPTALRILSEGHRDLAILRRSLEGSPEGQAALDRLISAVKYSPQPVYDFFAESSSQTQMNLYELYLAWCESKAREAQSETGAIVNPTPGIPEK
jgi:hypothetical protein